LEVNPDTAKSLGIHEGDWIWVETPWGKVRVTAKYAGLDPRVVASTHEWYYPEMMDENFEEATVGVTINTVVPIDPPYDPIAACARQRGIPCKIYKAESGPYEISPYAPY
jgi:anaerobic selenocysteine-containing dehydrogenase